MHDNRILYNGSRYAENAFRGATPIKTVGKWALLLVGFLAIITPAVADPYEHKIQSHDYSFNKPPDKATLDTFRNATRVETYRVYPFSDVVSPSSSPGKGTLSRLKDATIAGLPIVSYGPTFGIGFAHQLSVLVSDPKSYARYGNKCVMLPGVVFRIRSGKSFADVILCFHCSQIVIVGYDNSGKEISNTSGVMVASGFLHLSRLAFPKDAELQKV